MVNTTKICAVRFEHYPPNGAIGVHEVMPRISWQLSHAPRSFQQAEYEIETRVKNHGKPELLEITRRVSSEMQLVPWPSTRALESRDHCSVRVRVRGEKDNSFCEWSESVSLELGLLEPGDWKSDFISGPWSDVDPQTPQPEDLFRKPFATTRTVSTARLYITARGVYEAEINGVRVGDYFLAPGWHEYDHQLQYQTYDVTKLVTDEPGTNCIGIHVAEGWFRGRLGWGGGRRNIWGQQTAVLAQLELHYDDGSSQTVCTDETWLVAHGPILKAELYDGEVFDATAEIKDWTKPSFALDLASWTKARVVTSVKKSRLQSGTKEPTRRLVTLTPSRMIKTPGGKLILDFGQNLVGYLRIRNIQTTRGTHLILKHAEVLDQGELGTRPLRDCRAQDTYIASGNGIESYEPRFTFHGFRYAQIDASTPLIGFDPLRDVSAIRLNKLYQNTKWSIRGNFLSIPTDCPQRDERLGWTGDLAVFSSTATLFYDCFGILQDWLDDLAFGQRVQGDVPPIIVPNVIPHVDENNNPWPAAIWSDVTILTPQALFDETNDKRILERQYESMTSYLAIIPLGEGNDAYLWDPRRFQFGDWLDPNAPPEHPQKALTEPALVANAFLIKSLELVSNIAASLGHCQDQSKYENWCKEARQAFADKFIVSDGRLVSDTQTAYALGICFKLFRSADETQRGGQRLSQIVAESSYKIGTGFAGTPYVCEALVQTGHAGAAYAMLCNEQCPSWLYPITMGATTIWERWDSLRPDGSVNPGEMTSFNHYAFGSISKFLVERVAGLVRVSPGWKRARVQPILCPGITTASASHSTRYGTVSCRWSLAIAEDMVELTIEVVVPPATTMEVIMPGSTAILEVLESGISRFTKSLPYKDYEEAMEISR
ncbi:hypothetical protein FANTH_9625 [Fusarium anthophilum]|uniref:alpha-L-rhamnosidase n=1 Tax=Fusarium anthophilum TaxID=48485 RepID=A0A8H5DYC6_9HYPO|nr:hypothetical protein FANTH_9625 [Fusarium anthophilum]